MRLLEAFAVTFFKVFGITQPTPQAQRRAAWFFLGLLLLALAAVAAAGAAFYQLMHR